MLLCLCVCLTLDHTDYPDQVLYIEAPTSKALKETAAQTGPLWEDFSKDRILLKLRHGVENVKSTTRDVLESWVYTDESVNQGLYKLTADWVEPYGEASSYGKKLMSFISDDGIHPNENGTLGLCSHVCC
jgi:hypothetical protein